MSPGGRWGLSLMACVLALGCEDPPAEVNDAGTDAGALMPGSAATELGVARGTREGDAWAYRGIPYAAPPVGDLRWRAPEPAAAWSEPLDADRFGPPCVQLDDGGAVIGNEDCLTLNVWTPADLDDAPLPVMVHIHGGDNLVGTGGDDLYDGRYVVERHRVITVTVNYRLGAFGFLAHPALADETTGSSGNYALMDLIEALQWLQRNARAFGGDPERVMIYGYSAGSSNVCALVASNRAAGLFSSAIMQSGSCITYEGARVEDTAQMALEALGCDTAEDVAACLRASPATDVAGVPGASLLDLRPGIDYYVTIDGEVLTENPLDTFERGDHNHVPVISGTTAEEYLALLDLIGVPALADDAEYQAYVRAQFRDDNLADYILMHYPSADYATPRAAYSAILSDINHHCRTRRRLRALADTQAEPVYRYVFAATSGSSHSMDVPFVFHNFGGTTRSDAELALSDEIIGYFARFAATGDPNGGAAASWPIHDPARDNLLVLSDVDIGEAEGFRAIQCDALEAYTP